MRDNNMQMKVEQEAHEWHEHDRRILNEIGKVTEGMVKEGLVHKQIMSELGISAGFEKIFIGERNEQR